MSVFKNHFLNKSIICICICIGFAGFLLAQGPAYTIAEESTVSIKGTSSFHDWTANVGEFSGNFQLGETFASAQSKVLKVEKASLSFLVESIDGGRGAAMNKKIRAALKSTEHPAISFEISESQAAAVRKTKDGFSFEVSGTLKIAGVAKPVTLTLGGKQTTDGQFAFTGEYPMKLSTFEIEPPSAMFGQIVTGDDITLEFNLKFAESKN